MFVADFVGEANFFEGEVKRTAREDRKSKLVVRFLGKEFDLSKAKTARLSRGTEKVVVFRPEKLVISKRQPYHKNFVRAKIVSRRFLGEKIRYELSSGAAQIVVKRMGFGKSFKVGDEAFVSFDASDVALFDLPREHWVKLVGRQTE